MSQYMKLLLNDQLNTYSWEIDLYNDFVIFIEMMICFLIIFSLFICLLNKWYQKFIHWESLEIIWSLTPALILIWLGIPSIKILHNMESLNNFPVLNIKILGHQWYWEYTFPEFKVKIECYPIMGKTFRLLETSNVLLLPLKCHIQGLVTSYDVLHSWSMPNLVIKMDDCPGRLNFFLMNVLKPGIYTGQCSELCGMFHHMMPIYVEISSISLFKEWLKFNL